MKRIAFFVEGETEHEFIEKLLTEVAGQKNVSIRSIKLTGGSGGSPRIKQILAQSLCSEARYEALIYISSTDNRVNSDILEQQANLQRQNYTKIIGLRDLRGAQHNRHLTHSDLPDVERVCRLIERRCLPLHTKIVVAVMEIEAWFLADTNHYECIDPNLTAAMLSSHLSQIGFDPYHDDMTLRRQPAEDLDLLYQLVGKVYGKKKPQRQRTINCLDYVNIYLNLPKNISQLNELTSEIDDFLS